MSAATALETPSPAASAASGSRDVRPVLPRDPSSVWNRASIEGERIFRVLQALTAESMREAMVVRSNPGVFPVEIQLDCWFESSGGSERVELRIALVPRPHRKHPIEYSIFLKDRGRKPVRYRLAELGEDALGRLLMAMRDGSVWPDRQHRLRDWPFQWHLPRNALVGVRPDWVGRARRSFLWGAVVLAVFSEVGHQVVRWLASARWSLLDFLTQLIPGAADTALQVVIAALAVGAVIAAWKPLGARRHWRLAALAVASIVCFATQPGGALVSALTWSGGLTSDDPTAGEPGAASDTRTDDRSDEATSPTPSSAGPSEPLPPVTASPAAAAASTLSWLSGLMLASSAGLALFERRRRVFVYNEGRPSIEPRRLLMADYWNAVIDGLGARAEEARRDVLSALHAIPEAELCVRAENIVTLGPDGKEEREQLVMTFRRAIVFCHVYAYGSHLYVGWDAHLNTGQWREVEVARGMTAGAAVLSICSLQPSVQSTSEYDLHDLNCLTEWTHNRLTGIVRRLASDLSIDQEIDFKIQRVERDRLVGDRADKGKTGDRGLASGRFRRTA